MFWAYPIDLFRRRPQWHTGEEAPAFPAFARPAPARRADATTASGEIPVSDNIVLLFSKAVPLALNTILATLVVRPLDGTAARASRRCCSM